MTTDDDGLFAWIIAAAFVSFLLWLVCDIVKLNADCDRRGGHIVDLYRSMICVSADGRIIEQ